ncbi:MAG: acetyl-CoA hydrolase/transferase family protein [Hyphomicrobiales bacterium]
MPRFDPQWREKYADRLCSPEEAVKLVKDGDFVWVGGWTSVPVQLCHALVARAGELKDVTIGSFLAPFQWDQPGILDSFRIVNFYASPYDRPAVREGRFEYIPVAQFRDGQVPPGLSPDGGIDVAMIPISAPDEDGYCSFGAAVWFSPTVLNGKARTYIGEVHPGFIRTGGTNRVHISKFDRIAEFTLETPAVPIPPRSEETELAAQVICTLVANEIVYDGATVQFGIGDVSAALPVFLGERHDLGIHTELLPGGIPDLIEQGVVTNRHKAVHPGKVVAAAAAQISKEELEYIDENEIFEFHDFTHTDDLRVLLQFENFVAVNNALAVDITGASAAETMGPLLFSGTGGLWAFAPAPSTAAGGSVIVLPSSSIVNGTRHTRIVGGHPTGTSVTVHRSFVDFVVTEQGIAKLRGKSLRQRINEMISVAHPDFRAELRADAKKLYGIG